MSESLITVHDLSFSYAESVVNDSISLDIKSGEIFTLIGPNGCGKSTLLRLICGLIEQPYSSDRIEILKKRLTEYNRKELARTISMLPQSRNIPNINVERLVEHGRFPYLDLSRKLRSTDRDIIVSSLKSMKLYDMKDKVLPELSGGERQRTYLALTLAQDTPIVFLDEPTTYLDVNRQYELMNTIQELNTIHHKTIVMVLHDLTLALKYSDRIAVMQAGRIVFCGTPLELTSSHITETVFGVQCLPLDIDGSIEYVIRPC